jgi:hypothetical protein
MFGKKNSDQTGPGALPGADPGNWLHQLKAGTVLFLAIVPLFWLITTLGLISRMYHSDSVRDVSTLKRFYQKHTLNTFSPCFPPSFANCIWDFTPTNYRGIKPLNHYAHIGFFQRQLLLARIGLLLGMKNSRIFEFLQICAVIHGFFALWLIALVVFLLTKDRLAAALASLGTGGLFGFWFWAMQPRGGYMAAIIFMILAVLVNEIEKEKQAGAVLSGILCALAALMSLTSIGFLAVIILQTAFQSKTAARFFSRSLIICASAMVILAGAYAAEGILNSPGGAGSGDQGNIVASLIDTITRNPRFGFPENLRLFWYNCLTRHIVRLKMLTPAVAINISSGIGLASALLGILALLVFTAAALRRKPLFGWFFAAVWIAVFMLEYLLFDPANAFGFLPLIGLVILFSVAAGSSGLFKGIWALSALMLFAVTSNLNIVPLHARPDVLDGPDREALCRYFAPRDLLLCPSRDDILRIPYAMRMVAVTYNPSFTPSGPEEERTIARTLSDYGRGNHALWFLPPDGRCDGIRAMLDKYFLMEEPIVYPFTSCKFRTYYRLVPRKESAGIRGNSTMTIEKNDIGD